MHPETNWREEFDKLLPLIMVDYNNFITETGGEIGELDIEEIVSERMKPFMQSQIDAAYRKAEQESNWSQCNNCFDHDHCGKCKCCKWFKEGQAAYHKRVMGELQKLRSYPLGFTFHAVIDALERNLEALQANE